MTVVASGSLSDPEAFGRAIERFGRRSISQQLRRQGELAGQIAIQLADAELGPDRQGNRRRSSGIHYRNAFRVEYTGFEEFASGNMTVSVQNKARHAGWIEEGTPAHSIGPRTRNGRLRWPYAPYAQPGPPWKFRGKPGQSVTHPGFTGKRILRRAAVMAITQRLAGRTLGHARIRIRFR